MLATLRKWASLTLPTSIRRVAPAAMTSAAASGSAGMPRVQREVVGRAEGQDADRLPGRDQRGNRAVDGAVAAGDDDRIDAVAAILDQPRERVPVAGLADVEVEAVGGEAGDGVAERGPGARGV